MPFSSTGPRNTTSAEDVGPCRGTQERGGGVCANCHRLIPSSPLFCPRSERAAVSASTCCMCDPPQLLQNKLFFLHQKEEKTDAGPHRPRPGDTGRRPTNPSAPQKRPNSLHARPTLTTPTAGLYRRTRGKVSVDVCTGGFLPLRKETKNSK